ncbi:hypothetical protein C8R45DRAFT_1079229 [Mycena sanguinolenta]|nr:hypothetical protein C8R45DRAFT_1079229 [Mycena sanguinolenta]
MMRVERPLRSGFSLEHIGLDVTIAIVTLRYYLPDLSVLVLKSRNYETVDSAPSRCYLRHFSGTGIKRPSYYLFIPIDLDSISIMHVRRHSTGIHMCSESLLLMSLLLMDLHQEIDIFWPHHTLEAIIMFVCFESLKKTTTILSKFETMVGCFEMYIFSNCVGPQQKTDFRSSISVMISPFSPGLDASEGGYDECTFGDAALERDATTLLPC